MTSPTNKQIADELLDHFSRDELDVLCDDFIEGPLEKAVNPHAADPKVFLDVVRRANDASWLDDLVEAAAAARPDSRFPEFAEARRGDRARRFSTQLRKLLKDSLATTHHSRKEIDALLLTGYRMFAPESRVYAIDERIKDLKNVTIDALADTFEPQHLLHLVLYMIRMTAGTETSTELSAWIGTARQTSLFKDVDVDEARRFVDLEIQRYREMRLHLLLEIRPVAKDQFEVTAYRQLINAASGEARPMIKVGDYGPCSEDELQAALRHFIDTMEAERRAIGDELPAGQELAYRMVLELFVPLALHSAPADQWPIVLEPPLTLCMRHLLLLRSWERSFQEGQPPRIRNAWLNFWNRHKSKKSCGMLFSTAQFPDYSNLVDANDVSCVALEFVPTEAEVDVIVRSGTPVGVWMREPPPSGFLKFVNSILHHPIPDWRDSIGLARREKTAHAPHITLFWDDADDIRVPPRATFKPQLINPKEGSAT